MPIREYRPIALMIEDAQVARDDLVFQQSSGRDVDAVAVVGDDDDRTLRADNHYLLIKSKSDTEYLQSNILAEPHVARNRQMI